MVTAVFLSACIPLLSSTLGLGHHMARGWCCDCSRGPFAAASSLALFPLLPPGHTATWAVRNEGHLLEGHGSAVG